MTDVEGLVEFLTARLAELEARERSKYRHLRAEEMPPDVRARFGAVSSYRTGFGGAERGDLIGQWPGGSWMTPAEAAEWRAVAWAPNPDEFVLADIAAKRRIIEMCAHFSDDYHSGGIADETLKLFGLPFSDHRDYRQEWTP